MECWLIVDKIKVRFGYYQIDNKDNTIHKRVCSDINIRYPLSSMFMSRAVISDINLDVLHESGISTFPKIINEYE